MRHQCTRNKLGRPQDQRKALLRSLATELFLHGEITTTISKAKALKPYAEEIITLAKKGDLHSRRQAAKYIYDVKTPNFFDRESGEVLTEEMKAKKDEELKKAKENNKSEKVKNTVIPLTVLRKLFTQIGKEYESRNGGYTRIYHLPPRRGDGVEMALIQLV